MNPAGAPPVALPVSQGRNFAVLTLVLVFLGGMVCGAAVMRLREHQLHGGNLQAGVPPTVAEWKKQLDLSDEQTQQITSILDDFSHYYDYVLADGNTRIMQVLNPEQKRRFEELVRQRKR